MRTEKVNFLVGSRVFSAAMVPCGERLRLVCVCAVWPSAAREVPCGGRLSSWVGAVRAVRGAEAARRRALGRCVSGRLSTSFVAYPGGTRAADTVLARRLMRLCRGKGRAAPGRFKVVVPPFSSSR